MFKNKHLVSPIKHKKIKTRYTEIRVTWDFPNGVIKTPTSESKGKFRSTSRKYHLSFERLRTSGVRQDRPTYSHVSILNIETGSII